MFTMLTRSILCPSVSGKALGFSSPLARYDKGGRKSRGWNGSDSLMCSYVLHQRWKIWGHGRTAGRTTRRAGDATTRSLQSVNRDGEVLNFKRRWGIMTPDTVRMTFTLLLLPCPFFPLLSSFEVLPLMVLAALSFNIIYLPHKLLPCQAKNVMLFPSKTSKIKVSAIPAG